VYHNLALLRKGINHEPGIPEWIKKRASRATAPVGAAETAR